MSGIPYLPCSNPVLTARSSALPTTDTSTQTRMAPYCYICSYRQQEGRNRPVFHTHSSAREVRIMQGAEFALGNPGYMCPTCRVVHATWPDYGLNVVLGDSQLHNFHQPRDPEVSCPPDPFHIDWVTISGGTISDLTHAFTVDYRKQPRPMRIFVSAGLNDMIRGASRDTMVERFIHLKEVVEAQNTFHPEAKNELLIATILNPPKLVWFEGNGTPPANFTNYLQDMKELNSWIKFYNRENGRTCTPSFHRFGVRTTKVRAGHGTTTIQTHQLSQWRQSEPVRDMVHLNDVWRIRMGRSVIKYFGAEVGRFGNLD